MEYEVSPKELSKPRIASEHHLIMFLSFFYSLALSPLPLPLSIALFYSLSLSLSLSPLPLLTPSLARSLSLSLSLSPPPPFFLLMLTAQAKDKVLVDLDGTWHDGIIGGKNKDDSYTVVLHKKADDLTNRIVVVPSSQIKKTKK